MRLAFVQELADPHSIAMLLQDAFGNYVVQTALAAAENDEPSFNCLAMAIAYVFSLFTLYSPLHFESTLCSCL